MPTTSEDRKFKEVLVPDTLLDDAIDWIAKNLEPVAVFSVDQPTRWAEANGFQKTD